MQSVWKKIVEVKCKRLVGEAYMRKFFPAGVNQPDQELITWLSANND